MSYEFNSQIATCSSESWMTNSLGQSPCQVGSVLAFNACGRTRFYLGPIPAGSGSYYDDVTPESATACVCNTVTFMLISACAICQGADNGDWISYSRLCYGIADPPSQGVYPGTLPAGIAVPAWAYYQSGRPNFQFSVQIAKDFAGPDSTRPGSTPPTSTQAPPNSPSTTGANTTGTTTGTNTSSGTSTTDTSTTGTSTSGTSSNTSNTSSGEGSGPTATSIREDGVAIASDVSQPGGNGGGSSNSSGGGGDSGTTGATSRSPNVGAIAGGVVGGVVVLLVIGLLVCWLLRRRRARAKETHPEMSESNAVGGLGGAPGYADQYDDSELPPDYATVYGESTEAGAEIGDTTDAASASAHTPSTSSRPAGGSSKFPDAYTPRPAAARIQSVHKPPLPQDS